MKTRNRLLLPLLTLTFVVGCTQDEVMDEVTSTPISATSGGVAKSHDGLVSLNFPAGALSSDTDIRIETRRGLVDGRVVSNTYELGPDGLTFTQPVQIQIDAADETRELVVANLDDEDPVALESSVHDRAAEVVRADLEHFSSYGTIVRYDPCAGLQCGDACNLCNPAHPTCIEPPGRKACDPAGQCRLWAQVQCGPAPDAGVAIDAGNMPPPDAGVVRDGGTPPADGGVIPGVIQESEPNDSIRTANVVQNALGGSATVQGAITPSGDEDYFMFFVPGGATATVHGVTYSQAGDPSVCVGIDTVLTLFDPMGTQLAQNDDRGGGNFCSEITTTLGGGTYYFRVSHFGNQTIPNYFLDITVTLGSGTPDAGTNPPDAGVMPPPDAGPPADAGTPTDGGTTIGVVPEVEPNDNAMQAQSVTPGGGRILTISGAINPAGDRDVFVFQASFVPGSTLRAYTYGQLGSPSVCNQIDTYLTIYDSTFTQIAANDDANGTSCSDVTVALNGGGAYYVEVRHFDVTRGVIPQYYLDIVLQ